MIFLNFATWIGKPICTHCECQLARVGKKTCTVCAYRWRTKNKLKIQRGECLSCTGKAEEGHRYCAACAARRKDLAPSCPAWACSICRKRKPREGMKTCAYCCEYRKKRRAIRRRRVEGRDAACERLTG